LLRGQGGLATAKLSREHAVVVSAAGLVTITGGKWTTYRRMASDAVDHTIKAGSLPFRAAVTLELKLHGWKEAGEGDSDEETMKVYGSDARDLASVCAEQPRWNERFHSRLPYRTGEVVWAARHEAARTVEDVLARRTRSLFLDARASLESAPLVAATLAAELNRDQAWQDRQLEEFRRVAGNYLVAAS
jgi:glycerol-3-phosphate dehydrogenase